MHALAGRLQDRAQEGDAVGFPAAVGAGDMDRLRQAPVRIAERGS
ncbi:MAG: hypothetical protein U1E30_03190 [Rhodoblastus sp.]